MSTLRIGDSLDKCVDMGPVADPVQHGRIAALVDQGKADGATVFQTDLSPNTAAPDCFYPPTLVTNVQPSSVLVQEEIFGPVLVSQPFRTPAEAVALANNSKFALSAGVWTENIGLAMETALLIKAGTLWVNVRRPAVPFSAPASTARCAWLDDVSKSIWPIRRAGVCDAFTLLRVSAVPQYIRRSGRLWWPQRVWLWQGRGQRRPLSLCEAGRSTSSACAAYAASSRRQVG
jgi:hypothetical protein